jgi:signal transduction histidine kinase
MFFLGYLSSLIIAQPIQALREAAVKLGQGDFEDLPTLRMPNDEIGELAHTFMQMSESLKVKTVEIISAKEELEKLNRNLENRVEARTRELKSAQDELIKKERLAAIGQMASVVGHEIRNPLAVIKNSVYYINAKITALPNTDPKIVKHIAIIESEIQQANGIINEILGFARTRELNPKPQHLNTYIEDLMTSFPFPPHIQVVKEFAHENPMVNIDVDEMAQAIRNLMRNAIEIMPEQGILKIRTEVDSNDFVKMEIEDTGPGIPKDILDKIFAPFFTTKARGTGLGLAVVKKVIDRHKGKVEVFTQSGKGTIFRLSIPIHSTFPY